MLDMFYSTFSLKEGGGDQESRMFPDDGKTDVITCSTLTQDFLIFGTEVSWGMMYVMCLMFSYCQHFVGWHFAIFLY